MKTFRVLAIVPLALISLMNIGYPFGADSGPSLALGVLVGLLGLAGFVAAYGLARNTAWSLRAALGVSGVNVVGAVVALVAGAEGASVGLAVSAVAVALTLAAGAGVRRTAVA